MRDIKQLSAALLSLRRCNAPGADRSRLGTGSAGHSRWATNRPRLIVGFLVVLVFAIYGIRAWFTVSANPAKLGSIVPAVRLAITNPVAFAKSHVTGGIGAVVLADPATGLPKIQMVLAGSPAERAGLRGGDVILEIDGLAARGRTLAQNIDRIRGITASPVALTIQRTGSTNLNCLIQRSSWSGMGIVQ